MPSRSLFTPCGGSTSQSGRSCSAPVVVRAPSRCTWLPHTRSSSPPANPAETAPGTAQSGRPAGHGQRHPRPAGRDSVSGIVQTHLAQAVFDRIREIVDLLVRVRGGDRGETARADDEPAVQQRLVQSGDTPRFARVLVHVTVVAEIPAIEVDHHQRSRAGRLPRDAGGLESGVDARPGAVSAGVEGIDGILGEEPHRRGARRHRRRVRVEGPSVRCGRLALRGVEHRHHLAASTHRADRQPSADDLAEGGEVRRHPDHRLRAAMAHPERRHLVEDQHDAVPGRDLAHHLRIFPAHRQAADPGRHRIDDDGRESIGVLLDILKFLS